jgi:hypothetical protein
MPSSRGDGQLCQLMAIDNQSLPTVTDKRRASREAVPLISETTLLHQDHDFLEQPRSLSPTEGSPSINRGKPINWPGAQPVDQPRASRRSTEGIPLIFNGMPSVERRDALGWSTGCALGWLMGFPRLVDGLPSVARGDRDPDEAASSR